MIYINRKPFIPTAVPHLDSQYKRGTTSLIKPVALSETERALLSPHFTAFSPNNKQYDLVYIVKEGNSNNDLRYSLRSVCKFCDFRKLWIVGYKPTWIKDVGYIHTNQKGNKWKNSMVNYEAACNCPEISDNFILMNDDFFALRQIVDWKEDTNKCLGTIDEKVKELKARRTMLSRWQNGFTFAQKLLIDLNAKTQYNYETHMPIIINKHNFKVMLSTPTIKAFMRTDNVLHKRSIYKNLFPDSDVPPVVISDVKLELQKDLNSLPLTENWVSVYDYVVDNNRRYPRLNKILRVLFADKCKYEV